MFTFQDGLQLKAYDTIDNQKIMGMINSRLRNTDHSHRLVFYYIEPYLAKIIYCEAFSKKLFASSPTSENLPQASGSNCHGEIQTSRRFTLFIIIMTRTALNSDILKCSRL